MSAGKCIVSSGQETPPPPAPQMPQPSTLGTHLSQLLASPEELFSDVVLEVGEKDGQAMEELPCHANILSARSPVFRAMFKVSICPWLVSKTQNYHNNLFGTVYNFEFFSTIQPKQGQNG